MSIIKKFFGSSESSKQQVQSHEFPGKEFQTEEDELIEEIESLKKENLAWQTEFDHIIRLREKAKEFEEIDDIESAISFYLKGIELGEKSKKLNYNNFAFDIERVVILYSKTNQKDKLRNFLEEKMSRHNNQRDVEKWAVRLSKLNNENNKTTISISPTDINEQIPGNPTIGFRIDCYKKEMPEFNFYFDLADNSDTLTYNHKVPFERFKKLREYREAFETIKNLAKIAENNRDYKRAIEAYKKMIVEEYEGPEPYERLIAIYSKLKWKEEEKKIIEQAISYFTNLKEKQSSYVLSLAKKYNMTSKALEYIQQDKKIFYYGGSFELYNPQVTRLKTWKDRLEKLNK